MAATTDGPMREVITPAQAAALLQIHVKTVYRLARQGVLPGHQIGRRWRFSRTEILALMSRRRTDGAHNGHATADHSEPPPDAP